MLIPEYWQGRILLAQIFVSYIIKPRIFYFHSLLIKSFTVDSISLKVFDVFLCKMSWSSHIAYSTQKSNILNQRTGWGRRFALSIYIKNAGNSRSVKWRFLKPQIPDPYTSSKNWFEHIYQNCKQFPFSWIKISKATNSRSIYQYM